MKNQTNEALKLARQFHNLTQFEAAQKLDISKSYLCEIEAGKKTPSRETLEKYAKAFSLPLSAFIRFLEAVGDKKNVADYEQKIARKLLKMLHWVVKQDEAQSIKCSQ